MEEAKQLRRLGGAAHSVQADEARHKREQQELARAQKEADRQALYSSFSREKIDEMKHQAKLRAEMQMAYKTGDMKSWERLKARLEADA